MRIIRGKKAMVTGAASGIGRAIALELAKEGADLFLVDIKADALADVAHEARGLGVKVMTAVADLADPSQISGTVEQLRNTWKRLNILVNNAGTTYYGQTHLMTGEQWQRIMAVNLMAPIQLVHELLPMLLAAEDAHILNVSQHFRTGHLAQDDRVPDQQIRSGRFYQCVARRIFRREFRRDGTLSGLRAVIAIGGLRDRQGRSNGESAGLDLRDTRTDRGQGRSRHSK